MRLNMGNAELGTFGHGLVNRGLDQIAGLIRVGVAPVEPDSP